MTYKFFLLVKMQLLSLFGINKAIHSHDTKEKRQIALFGFAWAIVIIILPFYSGLISYGCVSMGAVDIIPVLTLSVLSLLTLFLTFFKVNGLLFSLKDHDIVMSMPVGNATVILSRLTTVYILNVLICFVTAVPSIIIYGLYTSAQPSLYLMQVLGIIAAPLIPIAVSASLGALIMAVSARFKYKNIAALVLSMAALLAVVMVSMTFNEESPQKLLEIGNTVNTTVTRMYPPASLYNKAITDADWGSFAVFALASVLSITVFIGILANFYSKINSAIFSHAHKAGYRLEYSGEKTPFYALYHKELRRLYTCTVYALNTCFGLLLLIAFAAFSLFKNPFLALEQMGLGTVSDSYVKCFPFVIAIFIGLSSTTASAMSLEGKYRWLMCSAPVEPQTIFKSKIAVNLTLLLPVSVISGLMFSTAFKMNFLQTFFMVAVPAAYSVLIAVAGLFFNLKFPKYDWTTEYYAVKSSASVLCTTMAGMIAAIILFIVNLALSGHSLVFQFFSVIVILLGAYALYASIKKVKLYI